MILAKSDKITLREFEEKDIELKIKWINDSNNNAYLHYDLPLEYEKTLNWFRNKNNKTRCDCIIEFDGVSVGVIGLLNVDKKNRKAEYYITLGNTDYKRKGISTKASLLLLEYAFGDLCLNKVYLNVDADNIAACQMYEKIGFKCEGYFYEDQERRGRLIDRKRYSFLKNDWNNGWKNNERL